MGEIADLDELTLAALAAGDFLLARDVSDAANRDKKLKTGTFPWKDATRAHTAGRVALWKDANSLMDSDYAHTDLARLSPAQTFALMQTFGAGITLGAGGPTLVNAATTAMFSGPLSLNNSGHTLNMIPASNVADNSVFIIPVGVNGMIFVCCGSADNTVGCVAGYRCTSPPHLVPLGVGSNTNLGTGALTGTTGAVGKVTVAAHTDGNVYIENRRGAARVIEVFWFN